MSPFTRQGNPALPPDTRPVPSVAARSGRWGHGCRDRRWPRCARCRCRQCRRPTAVDPPPIPVSLRRRRLGAGFHSGPSAVRAVGAAGRKRGRRRAGSGPWVRRDRRRLGWERAAFFACEGWGLPRTISPRLAGVDRTPIVGATGRQRSGSVQQNSRLRAPPATVWRARDVVERRSTQPRIQMICASGSRPPDFTPIPMPRSSAIRRSIVGALRPISTAWRPSATRSTSTLAPRLLTRAGAPS